MAKVNRRGRRASRSLRKKTARTPAARRVAARRKTARPSRPGRASGGGSGLRSVAPGFTVNDVEKSIAWYRDVLGFSIAERWEDEGRLLGAAMRSGDVTVNLNQDDWKLGRDRVKGVGTRLYITTGPLIDRLADAIKTRGGALAQEPHDDWGMRTFSLADPDGYKMTFIFPLKK